MKFIKIIVNIGFCLLPLTAAALDVKTGPDPAVDTITALSAPPPVQVEILPRGGVLQMGKPAELEIRMKCEPGVAALQPVYAAAWGDWEITKVVRGSRQGAIRLDRLTMIPYACGEVELTALAVKYRLADGRSGEFRTSPQKFQVGPPPTRRGDRPDAIRGLKGQIWLLPFWMFLASLILLALLTGVAVWLGKKRPRANGEAGAEPARPAEEVARERLQALAQSAWLSQGEPKPYYSELSDILRRYLEGRFRVPAIDRTTPELFRQIKTLNMTRTDGAAIRQVLEHSDLAKFAKAKATEGEAREDWQAVWEVVERTAPRAEIQLTQPGQGPQKGPGQGDKE